jgi:high-affinity Fe2+/Pb2+ permease
MKPMRLREIALVAAGLLCGFAAGIYVYVAFFLSPGQTRNGIAMFVASTCGLVGMMLMVLIRAEMNREEKTKSKLDT